MSKQQKTPARKQVEIEINGKKYPYLETMGAMMSFHQETGLDAPVDLEDQVKYMYHVVKSACRRYEEEFSLSFQEFADGLTGDEFLRIMAELENQSGPQDGKDDEKNV